MICPSAEEQTIRPDAALLFVAGAGWTKKQADGQVHAATLRHLDGHRYDVGVAGRTQTVELVELAAHRVRFVLDGVMEQLRTGKGLEAKEGGG